MYNFKNINELYQQIQAEPSSSEAKLPNFKEERWPITAVFKQKLNQILTTINDPSGQVKDTQFAFVVGGSTPWQYINALIHKTAITEDTDTDSYAITAAKSVESVRAFKFAISAKCREVFQPAEKDMFVSNKGDVISIKRKEGDYNVVEQVEVFSNFQVFINEAGDVVYSPDIPTHEEDFKKFINEHKIICYTDKLENLLDLAKDYASRVKEAKASKTYADANKKALDNSPEGIAFKKLAFLIKSLNKPFKAGKHFDYGTAKFFSDIFKDTDNETLIDLISDRINEHYGVLFATKDIAKEHIKNIKKIADNDIKLTSIEEKLSFADIQEKKLKQKLAAEKKETKKVIDQKIKDQINFQQFSAQGQEYINYLQGQMQVQSNKIKDMDYTITGYESQMKLMDEEMQRIVEENQMQHNARDIQDSQLKERYAKQLDDLRITSNHLKLLLDQRVSLESKLKISLTEANKKIEMLTNEKKLIVTKNTELSFQLTIANINAKKEFQNQIQEGEEKIKLLEKEISDAKNVVRTTDNSEKLLNEKIEKLTKQVNELNERDKNNQSVIAKQKTEIDSLTKKNKTVENDIGSAKGRLNKANIDMSAMDINLKKSKEEIKSLEEKFKKLNELNKYLEESLKNVNQEKLASQKALQDVQEEKLKKEDECEHLKANIKVLEKSIEPSQSVEEKPTEEPGDQVNPDAQQNDTLVEDTQPESSQSLKSNRKRHKKKSKSNEGVQDESAINATQEKADPLYDFWKNQAEIAIGKVNQQAKGKRPAGSPIPNVLSGLFKALRESELFKAMTSEELVNFHFNCHLKLKKEKTDITLEHRLYTDVLSLLDSKYYSRSILKEDVLDAFDKFKKANLFGNASMEHVSIAKFMTHVYNSYSKLLDAEQSSINRTLLITDEFLKVIEEEHRRVLAILSVTIPKYIKAVGSEDESRNGEADVFFAHWRVHFYFPGEIAPKEMDFDKLFSETVDKLKLKPDLVLQHYFTSVYMMGKSKHTGLPHQDVSLHHDYFAKLSPLLNAEFILKLLAIRDDNNAMIKLITPKVKEAKEFLIKENSLGFDKGILNNYPEEVNRVLHQLVKFYCAVPVTQANPKFTIIRNLMHQVIGWKGFSFDIDPHEFPAPAQNTTRSVSVFNGSSSSSSTQKPFINLGPTYADVTPQIDENFRLAYHQWSALVLNVLNETQFYNIFELYRGMLPTKRPQEVMADHFRFINYAKNCENVYKSHDSILFTCLSPLLNPHFLSKVKSESNDINREFVENKIKEAIEDFRNRNLFKFDENQIESDAFICGKLNNLLDFYFAYIKDDRATSHLTESIATVNLQLFKRFTNPIIPERNVALPKSNPAAAIERQTSTRSHEDSDLKKSVWGLLDFVAFGKPMSEDVTNKVVLLPGFKNNNRN